MSYDLDAQRNYLQKITHTENDTNFADSAYELQLLNKAYEKSAYKYLWPQTLKRWFDAHVAYVDRYSLQSDFLKFVFLKSLGDDLEETEMESIDGGIEQYAVTLDSSQYILSSTPSEATDAFVTQDNESSGNAVVVLLDTVSGLAAGDEIFISNTTSSEFTKIQSVDTSAVTITVKLANSHTSGKSIYRIKDGNYFQYQKEITLLSAGADVAILPDTTHLIIPHYAAHLYYKDIEEGDKAKEHLQIWTDDLSEAWLLYSKTSAGSAGQMTL